MLQTLSPLLGCGLMLLVAMSVLAVTGRRGHGTPPQRDDVVDALRAELARLRRLDSQTEEPAP